MNLNYDFSKARRGAVISPSGNKVRITIRLDKDIVEWFKLRWKNQAGATIKPFSTKRSVSTSSIGRSPSKRSFDELSVRNCTPSAEAKVNHLRCVSRYRGRGLVGISEENWFTFGLSMAEIMGGSRRRSVV